MALRMPQAVHVLAARLAARTRAHRAGALLVALSGIDGSGKGFTSTRLQLALEKRGVRTALVHADDWLSPPAQRFGAPPNGRHFYEHAIRFESMFSDVLEPLRRGRSLDISLTLGGQSGVERVREFKFKDVDVVLVEGIFLLRRELLPAYDRTIWVDCSFRTALERAHARNQESLSPEDLDREYRTIYSPAQQHHALRDAPRDRANIIILNDERLLRLADPRFSRINGTPS